MPKILYLDKNIVVAIKPSGYLSEGGGYLSFPDALAEEIGASPLAVHRLDRETEGIMVYALDKPSAAALSAQIQGGDWKKIYTAVLWGVPEKESGQLCDMLYYDRSKNKSFVVKKERKGVKLALLDYSVLWTSEDKKRSAVSVTLGTGRTHQIRVQFASRGTPVCGDRRYGAPAESGKRLALFATRLCFRHPVTNEQMEFSIEPDVLKD